MKGVRQPLSGADYSAVELGDDGDRALVLDQRLLPWEERYVEVRDAAEMAAAISDMVVRGAPAIGVAAAYGLALAARRAPEGPRAFVEFLEGAGATLRAARPTAVNLAWAVERMIGAARRAAETASGDARAEALREEARAIHREDVEACRAIGRNGAPLVPRPAGRPAMVLTHCNAGALATGGHGTALGVLRAARAQGQAIRVLAGETRPYLQGARLTAWELARDGFDVEIVTDGMPGWLMARGEVDLVVVGADRVARNGDVANKIGTYALACLAAAHDVPLLVAAPTSTVDLRCPDGAAIPIEERPPEEVTRIGGRPFAPEGVGARHPAFDATPARLVRAIVTERGVVSPVRPEVLASVVGG